ncbi:MAG: DUF5684 domain-containing protein [Candidatus Omnitrophota bacterium]
MFAERKEMRIKKAGNEKMLPVFLIALIAVVSMPFISGQPVASEENQQAGLPIASVGGEDILAADEAPGQETPIVEESFPKEDAALQEYADPETSALQESARQQASMEDETGKMTTIKKIWAKPDIEISGIMVTEKEALAVINDELAREGDVVNGVKVIKISDSEVSLEYNGNTFTKGVDSMQKKGSLFEALINDHKKRTGSRTGKVLPDGRLSPIKDLRDNISTKMKFASKTDEFVIKNAKDLLILFGIIYTYFSLCLFMIARKAAPETAWLAWLPIINIFLMFSIAGRSYLLFILLFVPVVNILILALLWTGIAEACSKPAWVGLLMFIPVVNFFVLGYLAFSK